MLITRINIEHFYQSQRKNIDRVFGFKFDYRPIHSMFTSQREKTYRALTSSQTHLNIFYLLNF